eukprot:m.442864 g.442864  ORF g.442864 m.442864 type:complete len:132 (+) comp56817_c0_seq51:917-1312(+)
MTASCADSPAALQSSVTATASTESTKQADAQEEDAAQSADTWVPYKGLRILEGLSASGLRAVRYFKEIPGINFVMANDFSESAVEAIRGNVLFNDLDPATNDQYFQFCLLFHSRPTVACLLSFLVLLLLLT